VGGLRRRADEESGFFGSAWDDRNRDWWKSHLVQGTELSWPTDDLNTIQGGAKKTRHAIFTCFSMIGCSMGSILRQSNRQR
jgi:hypothetical protein